MSKKSIIIIGAGIGGLSTGCYAQMNGYQTQIFEQRNRPGGLAATWKRKDYTIDGGIHFLSGHKPEIKFYKILREVGAAQCDYIDIETYGRFVDEKSGLKIDITNDMSKLHQDLLSIFPEDKKMIDELISSTKKLSKHDLSVYGLNKPAELTNFHDKIKDLWAVRNIWKYFTGDYNKQIKHLVKDLHNPLLGKFLISIFLPNVPFWFILMILSMVSTKQVCLLGDGSFEFANAIEKRYRDFGGEISYSSPVKKILVENNRAFGVELEDGRIFKSDYIISAVDGYHTIFELLNGSYIDQEIVNRYNENNVLPPYIVISFGVTREFQGEPWLTIIELEQAIQIDSQKINEIAVRIFNYSNKFSPRGKTVIQVLLETTWSYWEELRNDDRKKYSAKKKEFAHRIENILNDYYPGIDEDIEMIDVATPITFWRYTRSHKGSIMGFLPTPKQMMKTFKKTLPKLNNFYMAGQWSMPVGGVSPSIFSGRQVIQLICKHDLKKFISIFD